VETEDVQLILMDVMMPEMNGLRATMKIRETKNIPIIFLSAKIFKGGMGHWLQN